MRAIFWQTGPEDGSGAKGVDELANELHMFGAQTGYVQRLRRLAHRLGRQARALEIGDAGGELVRKTAALRRAGWEDAGDGFRDEAIFE